MFREILLQILQCYNRDEQVLESVWEDLEQRYSEPRRYYHNVQHPDALITELQSVRDRIQNWPAIALATAYHDVIYDVARQDNEAASAVHAEARLQGIVPADILEACCAHILATKSHARSDDSDTDYFTDADLSILGAPPERYRRYCADIRAEYSIYPDALYMPGRRKVLEHFLEMEQIFKTPEFYDRYEQAARANLASELEVLGG